MLHRLMMRVNYLLQLPVSIWFILASRRIHPAYGMGLWRKLRLGTRMFANTMLIPTASSYKSHLAMALKILEAPPEQGGVVVECGGRARREHARGQGLRPLRSVADRAREA